LTAIVGLVIDPLTYPTRNLPLKEPYVMLGGDSMALDLETYGALPLGGEEKVFRNGGYLFGVTGSFRSVGVLTDAELPPWPQVYQFSWVRKHFLPAIRRAFKRARCVPEKGDACLVAYGGTLFRINLYRRQAFDPRDGYDAIGSGGREALGSFHTSTARPGKYGLRWKRPRIIIAASGLDTTSWIRLISGVRERGHLVVARILYAPGRTALVPGRGHGGECPFSGSLLGCPLMAVS
jgi:hypothetical protein